jgi:hypothetical protein
MNNNLEQREYYLIPRSTQGRQVRRKISPPLLYFHSCTYKQIENVSTSACEAEVRPIDEKFRTQQSSIPRVMQSGFDRQLEEGELINQTPPKQPPPWLPVLLEGRQPMPRGKTRCSQLLISQHI